MRYFKHNRADNVYRWDENTSVVWLWRNTKWVICSSGYEIQYINKMIKEQHWTELSDEDLFIEFV